MSQIFKEKKYFITNDKCLNKPNNWSVPMATFSFSSYRNKAITIIYFTELKYNYHNLIYIVNI